LFSYPRLAPWAAFFRRFAAAGCCCCDEEGVNFLSRAGKITDLSPQKRGDKDKAHSWKFQWTETPLEASPFYSCAALRAGSRGRSFSIKVSVAGGTPALLW
jgi:hypothetical protein